MKFNYRLAKYFKRITLFSSVGLLLPQIVFAVPSWVTLLGDAVFRFFLAPFYFALELEVFLLPLVASYNNFVNEAGVIVGWVALRDLVNMFFILIILVIAFATIINVSSYGYRQLLSRLIIVAILINFSRTIVGFVIDMAQVVMLTFVFAIRDVAAGNIMVSLGLHKITEAGTNLDTGTYIIALILGAAMLAIAVVVVGVIIVMLTMRIVHLWIALVLSPVAFFAFIFPSAKKFYVKWSQDLGKNLISGPILAFFLWLAFTITGRGDISASFGQEQNQTSYIRSAYAQEIPDINAPSNALSVSNVLNYLVAVALLVGGVQMAAASGAAGASFAGKGMGYIQKGAGYVGRRYAIAPASRLGTAVSRGIVRTEDGSAKGRTFRFLGKDVGWHNIPFYGGRVQRLAQKMQGYDTARLKRDKEADQKYIKDTHATEFQKSQATLPPFDEGQKIRNWAASDSKLKRVAGKTLQGAIRGALPAYSILSSMGGGNFDKDALTAENMLKRGDIKTYEQALWATKQFRRTGNLEAMDQVQPTWLTYESEKEAADSIERVGFDRMMNGMKESGFYDKEKDDYRDGAKKWLIAAGRHEDVDPNQLANKIIRQNDKYTRGYMGDVQKSHDIRNELRDELYNGPELLNKNKDGKVEFDKKNIFSMSFDNAYQKLMLGLAKYYPQNIADDMTQDGQFDIGQGVEVEMKILKDFMDGTYSFENDGLLSAVRSTGVLPYENEAEYKTRQQEAMMIQKWDFNDKSTLPAAIRNYSEPDFNKYRNQKALELVNIMPKTDETGKNIIDAYSDEGLSNTDRTYKYATPFAGRDDLTHQGGAKEDAKAFPNRQAKDSQPQTEDGWRREMDGIIKALDAVDEIDDKKLKEEGWDDNLIKMAKERVKERLSGNLRKSDNPIAVSLAREVNDGMQGERGAEININNPAQAAYADLQLGNLEFAQEKGINDVGSEPQKEALVLARSRRGIGLSKGVNENVSQLTRGRGGQRVNDVMAARVADPSKDRLPQDPRVLGPVKTVTMLLQKIKAGGRIEKWQAQTQVGLLLKERQRLGGDKQFREVYSDGPELIRALRTMYPSIPATIPGPKPAQPTAQAPQTSPPAAQAPQTPPPADPSAPPADPSAPPADPSAPPADPSAPSGSGSGSKGDYNERGTSDGGVPQGGGSAPSGPIDVNIKNVDDIRRANTSKDESSRPSLSGGGDMDWLRRSTMDALRGITKANKRTQRDIGSIRDEISKSKKPKKGDDGEDEEV